ncbi:hypothetical protein DPMN_180550 [Dreissena polymorpha]|uniref:Uncharacterized protein n=1 Tax=Dreissena polymorpha TaxID=45954 RepID=A0A9D4EG27_DREPO|nr:hypothetical protein DPMN_180550 [Dreissena polymorpha]
MGIPRGAPGLVIGQFIVEIDPIVLRESDVQYHFELNLSINEEVNMNARTDRRRRLSHNPHLFSEKSGDRAKKKNSCVSGHPTDPIFLGPTQKLIIQYLPFC